MRSLLASRGSQKMHKLRKISLNFAKIETELECCQHSDGSLICYVKLKLNLHTLPASAGIELIFFPVAAVFWI